VSSQSTIVCSCFELFPEASGEHISSDINALFETSLCNIFQHALAPKDTGSVGKLPSGVILTGARGNIVVKAVCYKPEGLGLEIQ
jgi:hypothetical protein